MNKEQHLTYELGITNVPSDATCDDNGLEESMGMVYDDGEHKVIQKPSYKSSPRGRLLFVHKLPNRKNYIVLVGDKVKYDSTNICNGNAETKIAAVGKTLIINTNNNVFYALWKNNDYLPLGNRLPDIEVVFSMSDAQCKMEDLQQEEQNQVLKDLTYTEKTVGIGQGDESTIYAEEVTWMGMTYQWYQIYNQSEFNNAMVGITSAHLNDVKKAKRFCFPFWVRYAVRLYDGSYTGISNPVLMMPSVHHNCNAYISDDNGDIRNDTGSIWSVMPATYDPYCAALKYKVTNNISENWGDIVKGVDVFVSQEVRSFDIEGNWEFVNPYGRTAQGDTYPAVNPEKRNSTVLYESADWQNYQKFVTASPEQERPPLVPPTRDKRKGDTAYIIPAHLTDNEMRNRLLDANVFYKLFELNTEDIEVGVTKSSVDVIDSHTLPNLTTQTQLEIDDYYSHTVMSAGVMKTYNSRLHLANVQRTFFDGFVRFSNAVRQETSNSTVFVVYVSAEDGERIVVKTDNTQTNEDFRYWFYYPDPRAYRAEVYMPSSGKRFSLNLKEHSSLNGAYYFLGLPHGGKTLPTESSYSSIPTAYVDREILVNHVFVSEADNPFVFNSKGDVTVGNSTILGLATQTMALGQEEHGIHPLTVFSEEGLFGLKLNSEGVYVSSDIFSREVCNSSKGIIETDGAVFFPSAKGLMVVVGSQVKCVSEQLSGKSNTPFQDYLKDAFIAYDYRDSLLWIFDGASHIVDGATVVGSRYCYVYSIKSGTFGRYDFGQDIAVYNVVNSFPDSLLQIGNNEIYSLLERPNINKEDSSATYTVHIVTRPMKLGNGLTLKNIMQMRNIYDINDGGLSVQIFAKNDLNSAWTQLTHLRGTPWKYYQLRYTFSNLKATDRFAGTVLITQERRTNKLR